MEKLSGGYYIKARKIQDSYIAHAPPHVREIWDWLIKKASFKSQKKYGIVIERGQCVVSYNDIQEGLYWMVGYRKMKYSRWNCELAMKALTKAHMITTTKATHGLIITIINYDTYQNPSNYESHNENHDEATTKPQQSHIFNKEIKGINERKKKETPQPPKPSFEIPDWIPKDLWADFMEIRKLKKAINTNRALSAIVQELMKLKSEGHDPVKVIEQSIMYAWKGVFEIRNLKPSSDKKAGMQRTMEMFARREHERQQEERREQAEAERNRHPTTKNITLLSG